MAPSLRPFLVVWMVIPLVASSAPREGATHAPRQDRVAVSGYQGMDGPGLRLTFKTLEPAPTLAPWTRQEAREVVVALEGLFARAEHGSRPMVMRTGLLRVSSPSTGSSTLERRVREQYEALFGAAQLRAPEVWEDARWMRALKLSPRYMGEGVQEAAVELFSSPAVLLSVGTSMMLYMMAWAAPEPLFSKGFAAAVTLGLLMTYTAAELHQVGRACLTLYQEAEVASTPEQLDAVARRFGQAMGGVGLRVLVTVAGAKLARGLPEVPSGGLWSRLSPPRFSLSGGAVSGVTWGAGTSAQVNVANGTVVLMGISASTAAAAVASSARTSGACAESRQQDHHRHHLCTNKNDTSEVTGGPWTPRFEDLFARADMGLDDPANIVFLRDHKGPHPGEYHREVFRRLDDGLRACRSPAECRAKLVRALDEIAAEICTPGSPLNKLATRTP